MFEFIPEGYDSFVYLDTDTWVLGDLSFAFEKAEQHGIAVAPAPHYNLSEFFGFGRVLEEVGQRRADQMQYNTGVIFFRPTERVRDVFMRWHDLCDKAGATFEDSDQPFFTLAMEQLGFLPYVLSPAYNYRGLQGEQLVGGVRVWHSSVEPPADINDFTGAWPPRYYMRGHRL
jgi:lipopolysaccharide biosynthesis glycosyltransferase